MGEARIGCKVDRVHRNTGVLEASFGHVQSTLIGLESNLDIVKLLN